MELRQIISEDRLLLYIHGNITYDDKDHFRKLVKYFFEIKVSNLTIDCSDLSYIDSNGLGLLLLLHEELDKKGFAINVCNLSGRAEQLFQCSGLKKIFYCY